MDDIMGLKELVLEGASRETIADYLNGLNHAQRLEQVYQQTGALQEKLYDLCEGAVCTLDTDFVPADVADTTEVTHWGINSLALFRKFQKPMARIDSADGKKVVGFNRQVMSKITGPGYFTAKDHDWEGSQRVVVDYLDVPFDAESVRASIDRGNLPNDWPKILPQDAKLSRFIYFQTRDWMWKVSDHVTIGKAKKLDNWLNNWFILCREA